MEEGWGKEEKPIFMRTRGEEEREAPKYLKHEAQSLLISSRGSRKVLFVGMADRGFSAIWKYKWPDSLP